MLGKAYMNVIQFSDNYVYARYPTVKISRLVQDSNAMDWLVNHTK